MDSLQVCALKMKVNCEACRRKVKEQLRKLDGVQSFDIDANEGKVTIYSTLDRDTLIAMLAKAGKKAELLWEYKPQENNKSHPEPEPEPEPEDVSYSPPNDAQSQPDELDFHKVQLAHLQQLAKNKGLKQLQVTTHRRNIKMIFKDHNEDPIRHGSTHHHYSKVGMDDPPSPPHDYRRSSHRGGCPSQSGDVGGGGPCPITEPPTSCSHGVDFVRWVGPRQFSKRTIRGYGHPPLNHYPHHVPRPIHMPPPYYVPPPQVTCYAPRRPLSPNALYADVNCRHERNTCSVM